MVAKHGRLAHIDALRGLAALCVLVQHGLAPFAAFCDPASATAALATGQTFDLGRFGVLLFFLISGYVIPFSLNGTHALRRFAIRRVLRLYPPFWLSVAALVAVAAIVGGEGFAPARLVANLTMAPGLFHQAYLSNVYWTLFIELVFYGVCVVLFVAGLLRAPAAIGAVGIGCVLVSVACAVLHRSGLPVPLFYLPAHLSFLFLGTLIRMATLERSRLAGVLAAILAPVALLAMPFLAAQAAHVFTISTPLGVFLAGAAALAAFVGINRYPFRPGPTLVWLGAVSYSLYLFHTPAAHLAAAMIPGGTVTWTAVQFAAMLAITLVVSAIVYATVETPFIDLARRLTRASPSGLATEIAP